MKALSPTRVQVILARLAVVLVFAFAAGGLAWNGFSSEVRERLLQSMIDRPGATMNFRFILQPVAATVMAAIDGVRDARTGSSPYLLNLLTAPRDRRARLSEGLISTARINLLGLFMDVIYQLIEFRTLYPAEAAVVALLLAFVPYLLLRGPFARIARWWLGDRPADPAE
jgi:hypothetical protein